MTSEQEALTREKDTRDSETRADLLALNGHDSIHNTILSFDSHERSIEDQRERSTMMTPLECTINDLSHARNLLKSHCGFRSTTFVRLGVDLVDP